MPRIDKRLLIPGNLLLAGEYAIVREGRAGVTIAVGPPVVVNVEKWSSFEFVGETGGGRMTWRGGPSLHGSSDLTDNGAGTTRGAAVFRSVLAVFRDRSRMSRLIERSNSRQREMLLAATEPFARGDYPPVRIAVDSRPLFDTTGRKLGFGSSAASTVAATAGVLAAAGLDPVGFRPLVCSIATAAHRGTQGGHGSGYDVATSCYGGVGLFRGGEWTSYRHIDAFWLPPLGVLSGAHEESTAHAVQRFREVYERESSRMEALLDRSDRAVDAIATATSWPEARVGLEKAREVGIEIGRRIGIPADVRRVSTAPEHDRGCEDRFLKALGAGRETVLAIPHLPGCEDRMVARDEEGLRWA